MSLAGRISLVTGASKGIGKGSVFAFYPKYFRRPKPQTPSKLWQNIGYWTTFLRINQFNNLSLLLSFNKSAKILWIKSKNTTNIGVACQLGQAGSTVYITGKFFSEAFILTSTKIVHWITISVHENSKLRTCCVRKLFWISKLKQKNNLCTYMFWA